MKNFLTKLYLYKFFDDLIIIYPLYTVMFSDRGISSTQIGILLSIWSITSLLFEIPSGVLADKYSRRNLLFFSQIIRALGYLVWAIYPTYFGFMIGFIFWGIKSALTSGTLQALIYDQLGIHNKQSLYANIIGKTKTLSFIAILAASLLSSLLSRYGYNVILYISALSLIISSFAVITVKDAPSLESTHEKEYLNILRQGFKDILSIKGVLYMSILLAIIYAIGGALDEYWTLIADNMHIATNGLGIFLSLVSISQALSSYFAHKFEKQNIKISFTLLIIGGILLVLTGQIYKVWSLIFLILFSSIFTVIQILFDARIQNLMPSNTRATIASMNGFLTEIGVILVYGLTGGIANKIGYNKVLILYGALTIAIGSIYLAISFKRKQTQS